MTIFYFFYIKKIVHVTFSLAKLDDVATDVSTGV